MPIAVSLAGTAAIATAVIGYAVSSNPSDSGDHTEPMSEVRAEPATPSSTPNPGMPPAIAANGQVDIGGPGIAANTGAMVDPAEAAASPDPVSGLASWPNELPLAELTTPVRAGIPVEKCASPATAAAREMGNAIVAYLFTWNASRAMYSSWVEPIRREWERTAGYYGGEGSDGKLGGYTFEDRLGWLHLTADDWHRFTAEKTTSEVAINAVTTMMGGEHNLRLIYTVTITQRGDDGLAISTTHDVEIWLTAPCEHDNYGIAAASAEPVWNLTGLQFWDVRGWEMPAQ